MENKTKYTANILYAEDDPQTGRIYQILLQRAGYHTDIAEDGKTALELYEKNAYDLILLDMELPLLDGEEILLHIRTKGDTIPIIILSSVNHRETLYAGADDYLEKGCDIRDLQARIDKAIAMFATVKEAVGDRMEIGIDFHGRVHKTVALTLMKKLEEFNPLFIEEPLLPFNEDDLVELKRHTHLPIATGERLFTRWDFKRLLKTGAVDIIQPDLSHAGGIWEVRKIAAMAECFDVTVAPHCPLGALAFSSCIHLDVATPNSFIQEQIVGVHNAVNGGGLEIEDRIETDDSQGYVSCDTYIKNEKGLFEFEDGYVKLPKNPGLGPIIDEERLAAANNGDLPLWQQPLYRMDDGTATQW